MRKTLEERFTDKYVVTPDGCWEWQAVLSRGYGQIWLHGRNQYAHRVSYEMHKAPIPSGLQIDHLCRNTRCVNPAHLEPVTARENLLRGNTFQRHNAAKTHCPQGHPLSGDNLYVNPGGGRVCRTCSREGNRARGPERWARQRHQVEGTCVICDATFRTNRHKPAKTCSKRCANALCSATKRAA
jgi:hypothetical protein